MTDYRICEISGARVPVSGDIRVMADIASPHCPCDFHGNCDRPDICHAVKDCASKLEAQRAPAKSNHETEIDALRRGVARIRF